MCADPTKYRLVMRLYLLPPQSLTVSAFRQQKAINLARDCLKMNSSSACEPLAGVTSRMKLCNSTHLQCEHINCWPRLRLYPLLVKRFDERTLEPFSFCTTNELESALRLQGVQF